MFITVHMSVYFHANVTTNSRKECPYAVLCGLYWFSPSRVLDVKARSVVLSVTDIEFESSLILIIR